MFYIRIIFEFGSPPLLDIFLYLYVISKAFSFSYDRLFSFFFLNGKFGIFCSVTLFTNSWGNEKENQSLCINTYQTKTWCSPSPEKKIPLSTLCIKRLASKLCCAVSYERLCFCLIAAVLDGGGGSVYVWSSPTYKSKIHTRIHIHKNNSFSITVQLFK